MPLWYRRDDWALWLNTLLAMIPEMPLTLSKDETIDYFVCYNKNDKMVNALSKS